MLTMKNRVLMVVMPFVLFVNILNAADHHPKMVIDKGGFVFESPYKLTISPREGISPSELVVLARAGSNTTITTCYNGPIGPGSSYLGLHFRLNDAASWITTAELRNGQQGIYQEMNITPSSVWYNSLRALLTKFGSQFDPQKHKKKKYSILQRPKTLPIVHVAPLPGCTLHTTYSMRIVSRLSQRSSLAERVVVRVVIEENMSKGHQDKTALTIKAIFCTKRHATIDDPKSMIKYIYTKKGLSEISRENIKRSSLWYPWVKKIIKKSVRRYHRYRENVILVIK